MAMEMGDPTQLQLLVAAAQTKMEAKEECWQLLTVDEATYHSWKSLAHSQSLLSDSLVAKFLLQHYEKTRYLTLTECLQCRGPLGHYCVKCNIYMVQRLNSSSSVNAGSAAGGLAVGDDAGGVSGKCDEQCSVDFTRAKSATHLQASENLSCAASANRGRRCFKFNLADNGHAGALKARITLADADMDGLYTTKAADSSHHLKVGSAVINRVLDSSKISGFPSTENSYKVPDISKTQDNCNISVDFSAQENSEISFPSIQNNSEISSCPNMDANSGRVEEAKLSKWNDLTRSQDRNKNILSDSAESSTFLKAQPLAAEMPPNKHPPAQTSPQRCKGKADLPARCDLSAKVRAVVDVRDTQHDDETKSLVGREGRNSSNEETEEGSSGSTRPHCQSKQTERRAGKPAMHPCKDCGEEFHTKKELDGHLKKLHGEKPYTCTQCPASFMQSNHLTCHLRKHALVKAHVCLHCSKAFALPNNLKIHEASHSTLRPYVCDVCSFACKTAAGLKRHKRCHDSSTSMAYMCPCCGKGYRWRSNFNQHKKKHDGDNAFPCPHCPVKCTQSGSLRRHLERYHRKNRPRLFVCDICGVACYDKAQFENHMKIHTGVKPHQCGICGAAFIQASSLRGHMKIHTDTLGKTNWCRWCGAAFKRFGNAKTHIKKVHKKQLQGMETAEISTPAECIVTPILNQNGS